MAKKRNVPGEDPTNDEVIEQVNSENLEPVVEQPEESKDETKIEEPKVEESKDEPVVEQPEESKEEEPKVDESKEEPVVEQPKASRSAFSDTVRETVSNYETLATEAKNISSKNYKIYTLLAKCAALPNTSGVNLNNSYRVSTVSKRGFKSARVLKIATIIAEMANGDYESVKFTNMNFAKSVISLVIYQGKSKNGKCIHDEKKYEICLNIIRSNAIVI